MRRGTVWGGRGGTVAGAALAVAAVAVGAPVLAVDTVETWDVGATDVDFYLGYEGAGREQEERRLSGEIMLGYGLIERMSAYLGASVGADERLGGAGSELFLGLFGTPVETPHFDLDLFLDLAASHDGSVGLTVTPAVELNADLDPDSGSLGAFLHVGVPISGRDLEGEAGSALTVGVEVTAGAYVTVATGHQLLLAYDMTLRPDPSEGEAAVEIGGVALGYNVVVHDAVELITEARIDVPSAGEPVSAAFMAGFIATLPVVRGGSAAPGQEPAEAVEGDGAGGDGRGLDPEHEGPE